MGPDHASDGSRLCRGAFVCPAAGAQGRFLWTVSIFMFPVQFRVLLCFHTDYRVWLRGVDCACNEEAWSAHRLHGGISKLTLGGWQQSCPSCFVLKFLFCLHSLDVCCLFSTLITFMYTTSFWNFNPMSNCSGMIIGPGGKNANKSRPKLKAIRIQNQTRMFAFQRVCQNRMGPSNDSHQWINFALNNALQVDELWQKYADAWKLPLHDSNLLVDSCYKFLTCNHTLHKFFANSSKCLFQCDAFKHHWLVHAVRLSRFINLCIWAVIAEKASCTPWQRSCIPKWCQGNFWVLWHHSRLDTVRRWHTKLLMQTQRRTGKSRKNHAQVLALRAKKKFCKKLYVCLFPCTAMVSFTSCLKFAIARKNSTRKKS